MQHSCSTQSQLPLQSDANLLQCMYACKWPYIVWAEASLLPWSGTISLVTMTECCTVYSFSSYFCCSFNLYIYVDQLVKHISFFQFIYLTNKYFYNMYCCNLICILRNPWNYSGLKLDFHSSAWNWVYTKPTIYTAYFTITSVWKNCIYCFEVILE